jgi:hypothetical protein
VSPAHPERCEKPKHEHRVLSTRSVSENLTGSHQLRNKFTHKHRMWRLGDTTLHASYRMFARQKLCPTELRRCHIAPGQRHAWLMPLFLSAKQGSQTMRSKHCLPFIDLKYVQWFHGLCPARTVCFHSPLSLTGIRGMGEERRWLCC